MRALNIKLLRNLWTLKGQGVAIAAVIAAGVAMYVMSLTALESLRLSQRSLLAEPSDMAVWTSRLGTPA